MRRVGVIFIGCGNIATFYFSTLRNHPILNVLGVMDREDSRASVYADYYSVSKYRDLAAVLSDSRAELIINLTNPRSHYAISKACLEAGKHVYSEKPLAMEMSEAEDLVRIAESKGLVLASAPSRILGETGQTMWKALREKAIGRVYAAYAEMDGGMVHTFRYKEWKNELNMPWPYKDEFEVGCTVEHAGYPVSWLSAYFGGVDTVTTFGARQVNNGEIDTALEVTPPDLTVACLRFKSGVVARLTSSWIAPHDHSMRIFGDRGVLKTDDLWQPRAPVYIFRDKTFRLVNRSITIARKEKYPMAEPPKQPLGSQIRAAAQSPLAILRSARARFLHLRKRVDFCLGPREVAESILEGRPCRLSSKYCLHNTEVVLAISNGSGCSAPYRVKTSFEPILPMPWALS